MALAVHWFRFHFEVVGDILTPDILRFLETVPPGMFQFEIGIQTIDESVQESIDRNKTIKNYSIPLKHYCSG
ncbi:MAG: hypothetical protein Ct9H300mP23_09930 [Nitrospinota bacterium]|nr:MAG: hypothetical protein Ct9H300mP23_09930 [Nitrospinota bacterium]